jgi:hypothetical protein
MYIYFGVVLNLVCTFILVLVTHVHTTDIQNVLNLVLEYISIAYSPRLNLALVGIARYRLLISVWARLPGPVRWTLLC